MAPHPAEAHCAFLVEPRQLVLEPRSRGLCAGPRYSKPELAWIEVLPRWMFAGPLVMLAADLDVLARDGGERPGFAAVSEKERRDVQEHSGRV